MDATTFFMEVTPKLYPFPEPLLYNYGKILQNPVFPATGLPVAKG
jgi:hypothetical protein